MPFDNQMLAFQAEVRPILDVNGQEIDPEIGRGVYRSDTGTLMAICGNNFKPVQHQDVLDPMLQTLKDQGYEIFERPGSQRDFYDIRGQRGAFISTQLQDNGAVMRSDITVGDFVTPKGRTSYLDRGPDTMLRRYTALNSHNGKFAVRATAGYFRLICLNGMMDPKFTASSYGKHTQNFNVDALRSQIIRAADMMENDAERFGLYAKTKLSLVQAEEFLRGTLAKLPPLPTGEEKHSEPLLNEILRRFQMEDQTVWGLLNAMTSWATHAELRANSGQVTARIGREERVGRALRSHEWEALIAA